MICERCQNKGAIRVAYRSGESFDIALCSCPKGQAYRQTSDAFIRERLKIGPEPRIGNLEDFEDDSPARSAVAAAAQMPPTKKAKL